MCWVVVILVVVVVLFGVWASADVGSNIYLKTICKASTDRRVVALTFDDGPDEQMTPKVLDVLKRHNIKATFFLVGAKVESHPHIVRQMVEQGHIVANHTYSHSGLFPLSSARKVEQEVRRCNDAISAAVGVRPRLFRPPFGVTNPIIGRVIGVLGLTAIGWSVRSLDTVSAKSCSEVCRRVEEKLHQGAIILLHDRCAKADVLLESIINSTLERGYDFVTLDKMLQIDTYEN